MASRSEIRVQNALFSVIDSKRRLMEASQMVCARQHSEQLFSEISSKLNKASPVVRETYTVQGLTTILSEYYIFIHDIKIKPSISKDSKIYRLISDPHFLLYAYSIIRNRKVSSGVDDVPSGNVTLAGIIKLSKDLISHKYKPNPTKRVYIPKPNGEKRPLGIASIRDKIVQQALVLILEPLYEEVFLDCSFGFRKEKSTHTLLDRIRQQDKRSV